MTSWAKTTAQLPSMALPMYIFWASSHGVSITNSCPEEEATEYLPPCGSLGPLTQHKEYLKTDLQCEEDSGAPGKPRSQLGTLCRLSVCEYTLPPSLLWRWLEMSFSFWCIIQSEKISSQFSFIHFPSLSLTVSGWCVLSSSPTGFQRANYFFSCWFLLSEYFILWFCLLKNPTPKPLQELDVVSRCDVIDPKTSYVGGWDKKTIHSRTAWTSQWV